MEDGSKTDFEHIIVNLSKIKDVDFWLVVIIGIKYRILNNSSNHFDFLLAVNYKLIDIQ